MTEQERRRRRREMERRMRTRTGQRQRNEKRGGLLVFRIYVTAILTGGMLLASLFQTETSEMVCGRVKELLSARVEREEIQEWKEWIEAYFRGKEFSLPVFGEQEEEKVYRPDISP